MFIRKCVFLAMYVFCLSATCFAQDPLEIHRAERAFWEHRLSEDEQSIVDSFNVHRTSGEIDSFEVNVKLSKALKDEAEKIINSQADTDTIPIESKLVDFISQIGDKAYVVKGGSKVEILDHIRVNHMLQTEILDRSNILLCISCVQDTLRDSLYLLLYMSKYQIRYGPSDVVASVPEQKGEPISNILEINGKTNGKYLMYKFYGGKTFPFYCEGSNMLTEELITREDGSFSFKLRYSGHGSELRRLAIFVRNDPKEESYSLVDLFPVLGAISR